MNIFAKIFCLFLVFALIAGIIVSALDVVDLSKIKDAVVSWFEKDKIDEPEGGLISPEDGSGTIIDNNLFQYILMAVDVDANEHFIMKSADGTAVPFNDKADPLVYQVNLGVTYTLSTDSEQELIVNINNNRTVIFSKAKPYTFTLMNGEASMKVYMPEIVEDNEVNLITSNFANHFNIDLTENAVFYIDGYLVNNGSYFAFEAKGKTVYGSYVNVVPAGKTFDFVVGADTVYISDVGFGVVEGAQIMSGIDYKSFNSIESGKEYYVWFVESEYSGEYGVPDYAEVNTIQILETYNITPINSLANPDLPYGSMIKVYEIDGTDRIKVELIDGKYAIEKGKQYEIVNNWDDPVMLCACCPRGSFDCPDAITVDGKGSTKTITCYGEAYYMYLPGIAED